MIFNDPNHFLLNINAFILHKSVDPVNTPIHFAHALHVHVKYDLDDVQTIL